MINTSKPQPESLALAESRQVLRERPRLRWARQVPMLFWISLAFVLGVAVMALFAAQVAPFDPLQPQLRDRLSPPSWLGGSAGHLFGTDQLGRDIFSRVIYGARASLAVGFTAVLVGGLSGTLLGLLSGYFGGWIDEILMMLADMQLAFPNVLLAIAVVAVLGPSFTNLVIVIGISGWVTYARVCRGQVLSLRQREFVESVRAMGGGNLRIMLRHILPNTMAPLIVVATLDLARTIILEATLSYLGLGIQPPTPSWGIMLGEGRQYLQSAWWIAVFPGLFLMLVTLLVSRMGDWLRDLLDPTMRGA